MVVGRRPAGRHRPPAARPSTRPRSAGSRRRCRSTGSWPATRRSGTRRSRPTGWARLGWRRRRAALPIGDAVAVAAAGARAPAAAREPRGPRPAPTPDGLASRGPRRRDRPVAAVRRLRVTDRATGAVLGEVAPRRAVRRPSPGRAPARASSCPLDHGALEVVVGRLAVRVRRRGRRAGRPPRPRDVGRGRAASHDGPLDIRAIIPGRVASVAVVAGDVVTAGSRLLAWRR